MTAQWLEPSFFKDIKNVVVVAPHPDDDVLCAGALLGHLVKEHDIQVYSLFVTGGSRSEQVNARELEAREACSALGINPVFLRFNKEELLVEHRGRENSLSQLQVFLSQTSPELLLLPAADCHATHSLVRKLALEAVSAFRKAEGRELLLLGYEFWSPLAQPDLLFGFGVEGMKQKLEAVRKHKSQLKQGDYVGAISALNAWRARLARELVEGFGSSPGEGKAPSFVEAFSRESLPGTGETFFGNADVRLAERYDISVFGDIFLDTITSPIPHSQEEGTRVTTFQRKPGGNAANFSLMAGSLGAKVLFMSFLGRDRAGKYLRSVFHNYPDIHALWKMGEKATPRTFAVSYEDGKRQFLSDFGTNTEIHPAAFDLDPLWRAGHFHRAGFFWLDSMGLEENLLLLKTAREKGLETSLDTGTPPGGDKARFKEILPLLEYVDIYFGNETEICGLAGMKELDEAAAYLLNLGLGMVVLHGGEKGARAWTAAGEIVSHPRKIRSINPVGAGDVFNAAFIKLHLMGAQLQECLDFANLTGAYHVSHPKDPYPSEESLRDWERRQKNS